jgi:hypothetical protein
METGDRAPCSEGTAGHRLLTSITIGMERRRRLLGLVTAAQQSREAGRVQMGAPLLERRVATCMPDATATSIARQMVAVGNRLTDPEDGIRLAEIDRRSCRPAARATERPVERIARPSNRPHRLGRPIPVRPVSWIAIVPRARPAISGRPREAPSSRAECRDPHPEATAVECGPVAAAAVGADYRTRTPRSRR